MKNLTIYRVGFLWLLQVTIAFASFSQKSSNPDTINVNRTKFINALQFGLEGKAYKEQRDLLINQVDTLKARIVIKENVITLLNEKIDNYKNIVSSKDAIINTQAEQRKIFEQNTSALNRQLKIQKRKTRLAAFIGLLTTSGALYLFISK